MFHTLRTSFRFPLARGLVIGLVSALLAWGVCFHPLLASLEIWAFDTCFVIRGVRESSCPVTLVALDDRSLAQIDKPISFLSPEIAKIVTYLSEQGAAAIGLDVMIPEELSGHEDLQAGKKGDAEILGRAILESNRVVLPVLEQEGHPVFKPVVQWRTKEELAGVLPPDLQPQATDYGFVNLTPDADRFVRRQTLIAALGPNEREIRGNLAFALWQVALGKRALTLEEIPPGNEPLIINFVGPPGTIDRASFAEVLKSAESGGAPLRNWAGRIVIIGGTADYLGDRHPTPFANASVISEVGAFFEVDRAQEMPGPEIHANVLATLHDGAFLRYPSPGLSLLLVCLTGAILGPFMVRGNLEGAFVIMVLHHLGWRGAAVGLFVANSLLVPILPVLLTGLFSFVIAFSIRWRWMRQTVGMFKSEAIARVVEADPSRMALRGENRNVTILFCDVRNFTSFSETHSAPEVVRLLNAYFGKVVPVIEEGGGIVNQYVGDGLMVLFGAPMVQPDHAYRGVQVAVRMLRVVHDHQDLFRHLGADHLRIGIGLYTGDAVLGTVGSPKRLDYTAVGDTVNTAARIESETKNQQVEILVGETTYDALTPGQRESLGVRWEDPVEFDVKGKQKRIRARAIHLE